MLDGGMELFACYFREPDEKNGRFGASVLTETEYLLLGKRIFSD
jgi:hypothetical protein